MVGKYTDLHARVLLHTTYSHTHVHTHICVYILTYSLYITNYSMHTCTQNQLNQPSARFLSLSLFRFFSLSLACSNFLSLSLVLSFSFSLSQTYAHMHSTKLNFRLNTERYAEQPTHSQARKSEESPQILFIPNALMFATQEHPPTHTPEHDLTFRHKGRWGEGIGRGQSAAAAAAAAVTRVLHRFAGRWPGERELGGSPGSRLLS
jgi:hypothetical protein